MLDCFRKGTTRTFDPFHHSWRLDLAVSSLILVDPLSFLSFCSSLLPSKSRNCGPQTSDASFEPQPSHASFHHELVIGQAQALTTCIAAHPGSFLHDLPGATCMSHSRCEYIMQTPFNASRSMSSSSISATMSSKSTHACELSPLRPEVWRTLLLCVAP